MFIATFSPSKKRSCHKIGGVQIWVQCCWCTWQMLIVSSASRSVSVLIISYHKVQKNATQRPNEMKVSTDFAGEWLRMRRWRENETVWIRLNNDYVECDYLLMSSHIRSVKWSEQWCKLRAEGYMCILVKVQRLWMPHVKVWISCTWLF